MTRLFASLFLFLATLAVAPAVPVGNRLLVLVSIDAFRWDYLQKYEAPTLNRLARDGVHAVRLTPSFPSKTFPNHFTLVTGLRPEHHGIVSNYFYDPELKASFSKSNPADNTDPRWWQEGEPVWITAEKQGQRTACMFWPGDEAEIHGARPTHYLNYDRHHDSAARVDQVLAWLAEPAPAPLRFCALYLETVDNAGHRFGPDDLRTGAAVKEADDAVARLLAGLDRLGLRDRTDLVVVSDHGLATQDVTKVIYLDDLMDLSQVRVESTGPNGGVSPLHGSAADLAAAIRAKAPPHLHVYLRDEVPGRYHYRDNPRIPAIVLDCDEHWNIELRATVEKYAGHLDRGNHGWDPALPNMGAILIAHGPDFRRGVELPAVDNIHLYNLLCATLGLKPAPNDGDDTLVRAVLVP